MEEDTELQSSNGAGPIWSELPHHLVERLLACMPLQCLARFRTVCKSWNDLFSSNHFIDLWTESCSRHPPWLILCMPSTKISCLAYSFFTNTWHLLSLCFLPDKYVVSCGGSAAGLLLVDIPSSSSFAVNNGSPMLCVCNPLTRSWISLPGTTSVTAIMARGITEAKGREGYDVVVLGKTRGNSSVVEVYQSSTGTWRTAGTMGDGDLAVKNGEMVFCDGRFFCVTVRPRGVVAYDTERASWKALPLPVEGQNVWHRLLVCRSSVVMVGGVEKDHVMTDFIVWELRGQDGEDGWREIERMPLPLLEDFRRISCSNWFECVGVGRYVCFRAHGSVEVVVYDMLRRSWGWLPRCTVKHDDRKFLLLKGVAYQPRPNVTVS